MFWKQPNLGSETLGFGPSCAPDGEMNGNINQDYEVIKVSVQFIIGIHCEIKIKLIISVNGVS